MVLPGYQFHRVSRKFKRAFGGIGILVDNKFEKHTRIDSTYDHLVSLTVTTDNYQKILKSAVPIYGSSHTKLGQWLILRVVVFEHILSIFIFISPP